MDKAEDILLNYVRQTLKEKYCMISFIPGILKRKKRPNI
jgi:hypothetical protein